MNQFQLNGKQILAVRVEDKSLNHQVKSTSIGKPNQLCYDVAWIAGIYITNQRIIVLPNGEWDIIGLTSEIVKDEAKCAELGLTIAEFHSLLQREKMLDGEFLILIKIL